MIARSSDQISVWQSSDGPDRDGGVEDGLDLLAVAPDADRVVFAGGGKVAVREEAERVDEGGVAGEDGDGFARECPDVNIAAKDEGEGGGRSQ